MARSYTNFSEFAVGSQPSGFTEAQDAAYAQANVRTVAWGSSGKVLRLEARNYVGDSNSFLYTLLWTALGSFSGACEVFTRFKANAFPPSATPVLLRAQNAADSTSYQGGTSSGSVNQLRKHSGKLAFGTLASGAGGLVAGTVYGRVLSISAANLVTLKVWTWNAGAGDYGESTATSYSATDATPLPAGYVGVGFEGDTPYSVDNPFGHTPQYIEYDRIGVGTAGRPAPRDENYLPAEPTVTVGQTRRTTARVTFGAFVGGVGGSAVHAATQVRVRRVSDDSLEYGPASTEPGVLTHIATALPAGPEGLEGRPALLADLVAEVRFQDGDGLWSAWGTSAPFQTLNLWESGEFVTHVDVRVEIISGGVTAMQSLRDFGDHNWIKEWSIAEPGVDQTIGTARVVLHRQIGRLSLAPTMTASVLNQDGATYAPALDFGREVEIYLCNKPAGEEPEDEDWLWKFAGIADDPEWPGKSGDVQLTARDYVGALSTAIIRNEHDFGDAIDPPQAVEAMQAILDYRMGVGQYTVYDLTTGAGFAVTSYPVRDISALEAIENLAQQWGGKAIRQTWNAVDEEWQVGVIDPDREKIDPDYDVHPYTYLDIHTMRTDNINLRNIVLGHAEDETGKLLASQLPAEVDVADDPLVLKYGEQPLIFSEEAAKGITTQEQLDGMVAAIYADVSEPPFPMEPETKYCPFARVGDLPRWKANALLFDEDRPAAALLLTHTGPSAGVARTRWKCGGRPKGAYAAYRNLGVEVKGIGRRPAVFSVNLTHYPVGVMNAAVVLGSDTVRWRVYDKVGGDPDVSSLYYKGEYARTVRTASWSVGNGTHHVLVQGFSDRGTYVEESGTLVVSGIPGEGGGGSPITLAPGAPYLRPGPDFGPGEPTLESEWVNTSDALAIRVVYYREGVAALTMNLAAESVDDIGSYHAPNGSRVKVGVCYYSGAVEGPKAYSAEIVLGEEF